MKVAEQQARDAGFFEFNRTTRNSEDMVRLPRFDISKLGDWHSLVYNQSWIPVDLIELYASGVARYPTSDSTGFEEMADTLQALKNANYQQGYTTFWLAKVPKESYLWDLGADFGFNEWTMSFSIQKPNSLTVCHLDHSFELVNKEKVHRGGFTKDYYNRKIIIAVEDALPGQSFTFGSETWLNWSAGDCSILKNAMPHWGHNFSHKDRIFFMISGFADKKWCDCHAC